MYVCMYICKYVCMYVCIYVSTYVGMYVCMYAFQNAVYKNMYKLLTTLGVENFPTLNRRQDVTSMDTSLQNCNALWSIIKWSSVLTAVFSIKICLTLKDEISVEKKLNWSKMEWGQDNKEHHELCSSVAGRHQWAEPRAKLPFRCTTFRKVVTYKLNTVKAIYRNDSPVISSWMFHRRNKECITNCCGQSSRKTSTCKHVGGLA